MNSREKGKKFEFTCEYCGKTFYLRRCDVNYRKTIKYCSQKCYHDASRKTETRKCKFCGKEFEINPCSDKKFCDTKCACRFRRMQPPKTTIGKDGYKHIWMSDGSSIKEHKYIMEQFLGRPLTKNECVHHKDFNKLNNSIDNLEVLTRGEHSRIHRKHEIEQGKELFGRNGNE